MLRLQAFKFALQPNGEQLRNLRQFAGSCRFVYNKGLALNLERYEKKEQRLGYAGLCALLPNWKMEHEFLSEVPAQALQQALQNLERAYTNFFQKRANPVASGSCPSKPSVRSQRRSTHRRQRSVWIGG